MTIQDKLDELNSIEIEEGSPLFEYRYRINKYTNHLLTNQINITDFDSLLIDFEEIKLSLDEINLEKSNIIFNIQQSIRSEFD